MRPCAREPSTPLKTAQIVWRDNNCSAKLRYGRAAVSDVTTQLGFDCYTRLRPNLSSMPA